MMNSLQTLTQDTTDTGTRSAMNDAAARRRAIILAQGRDRMKLVSGGVTAAQEGKDEDPATAVSTDVTVAGEPVAEGATVFESTLTDTGSTRGRNRRRLQARNIDIGTPSFAAERDKEKPEKEEPPANVAVETNAQALAESPSSSATPPPSLTPPASPPPFEGVGMVPPLTTGGNTLRKRRQASRQESEVGLEGEGNVDTIMPKDTALGLPPAPSLVQTLTASDALVRFWLLSLAGIVSGIWVVGLNATSLTEDRMQAQQEHSQQPLEHYETRTALDEFVAKATPSLSSSVSSSASERGGWLGWVRGLFLPEAFDSLPLPILALVWHGVVVVSLMLLRPSGAAGKNSRFRTASQAPLEAQEPLLPDAEGAVMAQETGSRKSNSGSSSGGGGGGLLGDAGSKSMAETVAQSLGLSWVLDAWKLAQTAWQDVLIFSFFFLLAVAVYA